MESPGLSSEELSHEHKKQGSGNQKWSLWDDGEQ
jgi:hypothetical protein